MSQKIITVQIGGAGIRLGNELWERIRMEHKLDESGNYPFGNNNSREDSDIQNIELLCNQKSSNTSSLSYEPRTILVDGDIELIRTSISNWSFLPRQCGIYGLMNSALEFYRALDGDKKSTNTLAPTELSGSKDNGVKSLLNKSRLMIEAMDMQPAVQLLHSIGGGTGAGIGCSFMEKLKDNFIKLSVVNWTIFPDRSGYNTELDAFNTVMSIPYLAEYSKLCYVLDNHYVTENAKRMTRMLDTPGQMLNEVAVQPMLDAWNHLRFADKTPFSYDDIANHLLSQTQRAHFVTVGSMNRRSILSQNYQDTAANTAMIVKEAIPNQFCSKISSGRQHGYSLLLEYNSKSENAVPAVLKKIHDTVGEKPKLQTVRKVNSSDVNVRTAVIMNHSGMRSTFQEAINSYKASYRNLSRSATLAHLFTPDYQALIKQGCDMAHRIMEDFEIINNNARAKQVN